MDGRKAVGVDGVTKEEYSQNLKENIRNQVNYADDYIAGFGNKWEAEKYYEQMQERLGKFGLEIETSGKKFRMKIKELKKWLRGRRTKPVR